MNTFHQLFVDDELYTQRNKYKIIKEIAMKHNTFVMANHTTVNKNERDRENLRMQIRGMLE